MTKWVAFFSQTGSEIVNISEKLGRWPDIIVCSNKDIDKINPKILEETTIEIIHIPKKLTVNDYIKIFTDPEIIDQQFIISLHGWLQIIPPEICDKYFIYNGHPGLIIKYSELKGKDPQQKVIDQIKRGEAPEEVGSVIHVVTSEVDGGPIVASSSYPCPSVDDVFSTLHSISTELWINFLRARLLGFNWQTILTLSIIGLYPIYERGREFFPENTIKSYVDDIESLMNNIHPWELLMFATKINFGTAV